MKLSWGKQVTKIKDSEFRRGKQNPEIQLQIKLKPKPKKKKAVCFLVTARFESEGEKGNGVEHDLRVAFAGEGIRGNVTKNPPKKSKLK